VNPLKGKLLLLTLAFGILHGACIGAVAQPKPNIVIFLTDDHSQHDSTVYGSSDFRTPNMQRLADAGLTMAPLERL